MKVAKILKKNGKLQKQIEEFMVLTKDLLNESSRGSDQIKSLLLEKIETSDKIIDLYLLLLSEIEENNFLEINLKNPDDILNDIRILITVLLHSNESLERENKALRKIVKNKE